MAQQNNSMLWIVGIGAVAAWWAYENGYLSSIFGTPTTAAATTTQTSGTPAGPTVYPVTSPPLTAPPPTGPTGPNSSVSQYGYPTGLVSQNGYLVEGLTPPSSGATTTLTEVTPLGIGYSRVSLGWVHRRGIRNLSIGAIMGGL